MTASESYWVHLPEEAKGRLESQILLVKHRLAESALFTDEGLLQIIESHPRELANVSRMGADHLNYDWAEGDTSDLSAEDMLDAVRRGRMWLNIRQVMKHQPELRDLILKIYGDLEAQSPGFHTFKHSGNLLVSSPRAFVYYHLDVPPNMLWHIRGRKRVWVYPRDERVISKEILEQTVAGLRVEDLPYQPEFDDHAVVYDMEPGDLAIWPQNSPHRVENQEGLNISLSTEHYTPTALRRVRVMEANCFFRRKLKLPFGSTNTEGVASRIKQSIYLAAKATGRLMGKAGPGYDYPKDFKVDLNAPDCIALINPPAAVK